MRYSTRNALSLRISSCTVLPLYLYLDERHVPWMTDATLHAALADLRPMLLKKFHDEDPRAGKKSSVEVHRGATYQFAFFFRKTDTRHVLLLKKRDYIPRPVPLKRQPDPTPPPPKRRRTQTPTRGEPVHIRPEPSSPPPLLPLDDTSTAPASDGDEPGRDPLFFPSDESPLVTVKLEPMGSPPPPPSSQPQPQPEIPLRSASELHELRAGASESLRRTSLDTGFTDRTDDARAERETSEALLTFRAVQDEEDGEEGEGKDVKRDVKPLMRLSYQGFSIASRHLVLIIEPYPSLPSSSSHARRARSTYSRSMSRATAVDRETATAGPRGETPLVPNSRRGGTGSVRPGVVVGDPAARQMSLVPNARSGGRLASSTPLFREMTPMSAFGDDSAPPSRGPALFAEEDSSEEEDTAWRKRVRQGSYAPWRGASAVPGQTETSAAPPSGRRITESDDSDDLDDDDDDAEPASDDDDDDAQVAQARRLMALSQRLQGNTEGRAGAAGAGAGAVGVDAGELGRGDEDDAYGEGDGGFADDVGGADA